MNKVKSLAELIIEAGDEMDVTVRQDYSGRGMYGRRCLAVSGDASDLNALMAEVAYNLAPLSAEGYEGNQRLREELETLFNYSQDNLGMGRIYYWPGVSLQEQG